MFRTLRRKKRAITDEDARELLATCKRGVFAVNGDDGYPYAIPVNYFFDAVFGRCRLANDTPEFIEDKVRELALKYYPSAEEVEEEIAKDIKGVQLYEITIEHLCGKQIQEK